MYHSSSKYRLAELNQHNLEASSQLLAQMFMKQNKTWAAVGPSFDEAYRFMKDKTKEMLQWQQQLRNQGTIGSNAFINFVYMDEKDNIAGVWTNFELTQYLRKNSKVYLKQFDTLERYGKELQKSINSEDVIPGKSINGMFMAIRPELMGTKFVGYFWHDGIHYIHSQGFRMMYGRASNIKSKVLFQKIGGEMIAKVKGVENGKTVTLSFLKLGLKAEDISALKQILKRLEFFPKL